MSVRQIAEGFYNNLVKKEEDLHKKRIDICKKCPLWKIDSVWGPICNPSLYINENNEISNKNIIGYIKGCGCVLNSKTRVPDSKCIINKW